MAKLPNDEETAKWFEENIGIVNGCCASSAIYKFRCWLQEREQNSESKDGNCNKAAVSNSAISPHEASMVKCDLCNYKWTAVRPEGVEKLECPKCGNVGCFENI